MIIALIYDYPQANSNEASSGINKHYNNNGVTIFLSLLYFEMKFKKLEYISLINIYLIVNLVQSLNP